MVSGDGNGGETTYRGTHDDTFVITSTRAIHITQKYVDRRDVGIHTMQVLPDVFLGGGFNRFSKLKTLTLDTRVHNNALKL